MRDNELPFAGNEFNDFRLDLARAVQQVEVSATRSSSGNSSDAAALIAMLTAAIARLTPLVA